MQNIPLAEMRQFILEKTKAVAEAVGDRIPSGTNGAGELLYTTDCGWTGGFWPGLLNYCYLMSGDSEYLALADRSRERFLERLYQRPETLDHDVGFLFLPSECARYRLQGSLESRKAGLDAADVLLSRYNQTGRFIQAWNDWGDGTELSRNHKGRIIIDCMYNLPLLYWASGETGNPDYEEAASCHARTSMETLVRADGTTYHTYVFDPVTGKRRFGQTYQGYRDDSCWARGQAWALGGFAMAYRFSGRAEFLDCSRKTADVFIQSLEEDFIPVWDFALRGQEAPRDASAAAIAASGLLELAGFCVGDEQNMYQETAERILLSLWQGYASRDEPSYMGLIRNCVGFYGGGSYEYGENVIYADYYFAEAVSRLSGYGVILS